MEDFTVFTTDLKIISVSKLTSLDIAQVINQKNKRNKKFLRHKVSEKAVLLFRGI